MNMQYNFLLFVAVIFTCASCKDDGAAGLDYGKYNNPYQAGKWQVTAYEYITYDTAFNKTVVETLSGDLAMVDLSKELNVNSTHKGEVSSTTRPRHGGLIFAMAKENHVGNVLYKGIVWTADQKRINLGIEIGSSFTFSQGSLLPWGSNSQTWEFIGFPASRQPAYMIKERYSVVQK